MPAQVSKEDIVAGLRLLNVKDGDMLLVHSSLSTFGHVIGGAAAVVDALLEAVGSRGTVMVPTFTHNHEIVFDPTKTPSVSGAITNAFWQRPQARRSLHTTHAYAAIGPKAQWLTANHELATTFGPASPLGKFCRAGGDVLLLGVGLNRATAMHLGETLAGASCLGERTVPDKYIHPETKKITTVWTDSFRNGRCPAGDLAEVERTLRAAGSWHETTIGAAQVIKINGWDIVEGFRDLLSSGWNNHPGCRGCTVPPHKL